MALVFVYLDRCVFKSRLVSRQFPTLFTWTTEAILKRINDELNDKNSKTRTFGRGSVEPPLVMSQHMPHAPSSLLKIDFRQTSKSLGASSSEQQQPEQQPEHAETAAPAVSSNSGSISEFVDKFAESTKVLAQAFLQYKSLASQAPSKLHSSPTVDKLVAAADGMAEGFRLSQQEKCGNEDNRKDEDNGKTVEVKEIVDNEEHEQNEENILSSDQPESDQAEPEPDHSEPTVEVDLVDITQTPAVYTRRGVRVKTARNKRPIVPAEVYRSPYLQRNTNILKDFTQAEKNCLDNVDVAAAQLQDRLINLLQSKLPSVTGLTSMAMPEVFVPKSILKCNQIDNGLYLLNILENYKGNQTNSLITVNTEAQLRRFALRVCHQIATCSGNLSKEIVEKDALELSSSLGLPFTNKELVTCVGRRTKAIAYEVLVSTPWMEVTRDALQSLTSRGLIMDQVVDAETNPEIWGQYIKPQYIPADGSHIDMVFIPLHNKKLKHWWACICDLKQ
ncbi:hypothetical protein KSS87_002219 [Heliosperma pusillum]|nr:hypothetical protein KSS87_002219 [Heliosperma pusillum]